MRLNDLTVSRLGGAKGGVKSLSDLTAAWFLKERGATHKAMKNARLVVREALKSGNNGQIITNGNRKSGHKRLVLVRLPEAYYGVGMDAVMAEYLRGHPKDPYPDVVVLFHADGQPDILTQVEYSGPGERIEHVAAWITPNILTEWKAQRLTVFGGGGLESCYFVAKGRDRTDADTLNTVADGLLNDLLIRNRPIEAWRTSFLQPLYLGPDGLSCDRAGQTHAPLKEHVLSHLKSMRETGLSRWRAERESDGDATNCPESEGTNEDASRARHVPCPVWVDAEERGYFMPHLRDIIAVGPELTEGEGVCRFSDTAWKTATDAARRGNRLVSFELP